VVQIDVSNALFVCLFVCLFVFVCVRRLTVDVDCRSVLCNGKG
jgi:hypothetical protein